MNVSSSHSSTPMGARACSMPHPVQALLLFLDSTLAWWTNTIKELFDALSARMFTSIGSQPVTSFAPSS